MGGKAHFYDGLKRLVPWTPTTQNNTTFHRKTLIRTMYKVTDRSTRLDCIADLDAVMYDVYAYRQLKEVEPATLSVYMLGWWFPANLKTGFREKWGSVLDRTQGLHVAYMRTFLNRTKVTVSEVPGKQRRTPLKKWLVEHIVAYVADEVKTVERYLQTFHPGQTIWSLTDTKFEHWKRVKILRSYERVLGHCTQGYMQPSRSGEHCRNTVGKDNIVIDPVTGRTVGKHMRISFVLPLCDQTQLPTTAEQRAQPFVLQAFLRFGRKGTTKRCIANFKVPPRKEMNCFYYIFRRLGIPWTTHWFRDKRFFDIAGSDAYRLVPLHMAHYQQHLIPEHVPQIN